MDTQLARAVVVYCASSERCDFAYHEGARRLGGLLARDNRTVVYGGGRVGSMGALADGALAAGGRVIGVLPRFLNDLELAHDGLTELHVVEDMRVRKHAMLTRSQAVIALPGGSGTLEELLEAITLKRLGVYAGPIILVNMRNYYSPLLAMLANAIAERFMQEPSANIWQVVPTPDDVVPALAAALRSQP